MNPIPLSLSSSLFDSIIDAILTYDRLEDGDLWDEMTFFLWGASLYRHLSHIYNDQHGMLPRDINLETQND